MRRGTYRGVALVSAALLTVSLAASAAARPGSAGSDRFELVEGAAFNYSGFKPASLDANRQVKVILRLEGASVGERMAAAKQRGGELSAAAKASIRSALESRQDGLASQIGALGGKVIAEYQDAYNGLAASVPVGQLAALKTLPGVTEVHLSRVIERDNIPGAQYVRAPETWTDTGFTGTGTKVAVIDTGVDYTHKNFGGPGTPAAFDGNDGTIIEPGTFPTAKVVAGFDFVGDDYRGPNEPQPDPDPLDCNGHGSHVSGSAAGFGVLANGATFGGPYDSDIYTENSFRIGPGVAPEASIIAIRVFGCVGFTTEDILVDALDFALANGADVVNMSLGSVFGREDEPSTQASNTLAQAGVVVVASAGNSGANSYITGAPAVADRSISVAAIDASSATFPGANINFASGGSLLVQNSNDATLPGGPMQIAVLRTSYPSGPVSLGCSPADYAGFPGGVVGKLVVTVRGVCARVARAVFGQQAGAAAVAMINTDAGFPPFEGEITGNPDTGEEFLVTIPFLGVRGVISTAPTADPELLISKDGDSATLTPSVVPNPGYQFLAGFSSGGPENVSSQAKPDVTAPGVSVLSTLIGSGDKGTRVSGTSMAAPHTAGVAALVTQAHPSWSTEMIKGAMMNTANASTAKILGYDSRRAGTGVVDARRAVDTQAVVSTTGGTGALSYGYEPKSSAYTETLPFTIHNAGSSPITYDLSAAFVGNSLGADVAFSTNPVTVPGGGSATVNATLSLTAAEIAALPGASSVSALASSNPNSLGNNRGHVITARGAVVATPTEYGSETGLYPLRVPFLVAPRGLSNVTVGPRAPYVRTGNTITSSAPLSNSGIHSGIADVYTWGIQDDNDVAHPEDSMDVRVAGVQSFPFGASGTDRLLVFAINNHGQSSTESINEFDISIDRNNDGNPEFFVVGVDIGAVLAGSFDGRFGSFIFNAAGNLVGSIFFADAPSNGSTVLLPVIASQIGLVPGNSRFKWSIAAFSIVPGFDLVDTTGTGTYDPFNPPTSNGDFIALPPGGSATLNLSSNVANFFRSPALGWMVVTQDDPNGAPQADTILFGS